jgi:hypothetical protein
LLQHNEAVVNFALQEKHSHSLQLRAAGFPQVKKMVTREPALSATFCTAATR